MNLCTTACTWTHQRFGRLTPHLGGGACDEAHQANRNQLQYELAVSPECCIHSQDTQNDNPPKSPNSNFSLMRMARIHPPVYTSEVKPAAEVVETEVDALNQEAIS